MSEGEAKSKDINLLHFFFSWKEHLSSLNQGPEDYWDSSCGDRHIPGGRHLVLNSLDQYSLAEDRSSSAIPPC